MALYACPYCGMPIEGKVIGMKNGKPVRTMCSGCEKYIGSEAAQQEGATMQNRIQMQRLFRSKQNASLAS